MSADMKDTIARTAIRLLLEKREKKLTVTNLVEACQITRQTFYYHFADILLCSGGFSKRESSG